MNKHTEPQVLNRAEWSLPTDDAAIQVPEWYDPSTAATFDPNGYWVPPLAAGVYTTGDKISVIVLRHRTFEPVFIRELPDEDDNTMGRVHAGSIPVFMQHLAPVGAVYDRTRRPHRRELSV
jgi:hypothetical protein